jgi:heme oxygenase
MSTKATEETAISTEQSTPATEVNFPPILEELRDVAMRLHTKEQAPREGQVAAPAKPAVPYVPTQKDYLQFLVDSNAVYVALEEIVNENEKLAMFRNSGLERTQELEKDIAWMCNKYNLERPEVGAAGKRYAEELKAMVKSDDDIPEFMCHYYNFYFAHMAGGRMIGKQMSKLLLDGETLEFYKVSNVVVYEKRVVLLFAANVLSSPKNGCYL